MINNNKDIQFTKNNNEDIQFTDAWMERNERIVK